MFQINSINIVKNKFHILSKYCHCSQRSGLWLLFTSTITSTWRYRKKSKTKEWANWYKPFMLPLECQCNSLLAHNLAKIFQVEAYSSLFNHDFICISETYFDSSDLEGDRSFKLNGYNLLRTDHLSNTKRGGVCIYYKESLCLYVSVKWNYQT